MRRETGQLSLAEALVGGGKGGARLERIAALLGWSELDPAMGGLRSAPTGRPGQPPLVMPKARRSERRQRGRDAPRMLAGLLKKLPCLGAGARRSSVCGRRNGDHAKARPRDEVMMACGSPPRCDCAVSGLSPSVARAARDWGQCDIGEAT